MKHETLAECPRPLIRRSSLSPSRLVEDTRFDGETPFVLIEKFFGKDDITIPHYGNNVEIIINIGAEGIFRVDDMSYDMKGCQILYIPPNHIHSNSIKAGGGRQLILKLPADMNYSPVNFEGLLALQGGSLFCEPFLLEDIDEIISCADGIIGDEADTLLCLMHLMKLLSILSPHMKKSAACRRGMGGSHQSETLKKLIDFTEEHFTEPLSNKTAANHIGYDVVYFCRWFRRQSGMTYNEYLMLLKIRCACRMLENNRSVTEVIGRLGYSNISFFRRKFKSCVGCTPKEYQCRVRPANGGSSEAMRSNNNLTVREESDGRKGQ